VYFNREKYKESIDIDKIVADKKVSPEGVKRYEAIIEAGKEVGIIVVVKHPNKKQYAVLDGHHKYWAGRNKNLKKMNCAVVIDLLGSLFYLTIKGYLQPPPEFTQYIRIPLKRIKKNWKL
jgi:hypothetical protein